ncbi:MAG: DUF1015 domain-containing protein, partial [Rhodothermales bacterium]
INIEGSYGPRDYVYSTHLHAKCTLGTMAVLHPFRALRPHADVVDKVACVPYDVIDVDEARALAEGNPSSFLHVIRPEIDLPDETDEHADEVYEKGAENLRAYRSSELSLEEEAASVYIYRLEMKGRSQTGIYACVAVADYDENRILKHEKTRPDKEDDRTRHILTQRAHAEPVMLTYAQRPTIADIVGQTTQRDPLYDFTTDDGVRHTVWTVGNRSEMVAEFAMIPRLYVADGHHRCKAASRAAEKLRDGTAPDAEFEFFPAALFPMEEMQILPYNRVVYRLPESEEDFLKKLQERFDVESEVDPVPPHKGRVCLYVGGRWHRFALPPTERDTIADALDVARLNEFVLEPMLGIKDPRTDSNIGFVGGIRGTGELEHLVRNGRASIAFSMYPTAIEELISVSDAGLLMPPKSTWFEPKLRSGILVHLFD